MSTITSSVSTDTVTTTGSDRFLRTWLRLDAAASGATGLGMAAGGSLVDSALGVPAAAIRGIGIFLVVYAAAIAVLSFRARIHRGAAWTVIVLNTLWVIDSVITLATGLWDVTGAGIGFIVFMAVVVAGFAELQYLGLRRMR